MSRKAIFTIVVLAFGLNSFAVGQVISLGPGGLKVTPGAPQVRPLPITSPVDRNPPVRTYPVDRNLPITNPVDRNPPVSTYPVSPNPPRTTYPIYPTPQPPVTTYPVQPSPRPVPPTFIPPSHGQYPVYVTPNEVVGVNPHTGGLDTQNRQIDNTAFQHGRNESQHNGTKRWVQRPIYNSQGQQVGYQEGWVWNNSYTGQEHGDLNNYTPNDKGGINNQNQIRSVNPGVHNNQQSYSARPRQGGAQPGGVHKNVQSYSAQ